MESAENQIKKKTSLNKFTHLSKISGHLLDEGSAIEKVETITAWILKAQPCYLREIAEVTIIPAKLRQYQFDLIEIRTSVTSDNNH